MSERGVFAIDRGAWEHDFLADDQPFSRREAWFWLVSEAAWKPHRRRIMGRPIDLVRGQFVGSLRFIASKWRWSEPRVRRFLSGLISEGMVDAKTDAGVTVITICNYDKYQRVSLPSDAMRESDVDAGATQERRKVEDKEYKEDNTSSLRSDDAGASDPRTRLFREGLSKVAAMTGKGPDSCRSFLGKCLKEVGDDAIVVLAAIEDAERNRVVDPSAYIARILKGRSHGQQTGSAVIQAADDLRRKVASFNGPSRPVDGLRSGAGEAAPRLLPDR